VALLLRVSGKDLLSRGTAVAAHLADGESRGAIGAPRKAGGTGGPEAAAVTDSLWQEVSVAKEDRGFASMDRVKQREIASKGGKAAHQKGTAHEWTSEEAREAGRKGGMASHRRRTGGDQTSAAPGGAMPAGGSATPDTAERSGSGDEGEQIR
jgi:uncharacterized protein